METHGIFVQMIFMYESLLKLRQELHRFPELSGNEKQTARRIVDFLKPLGPDRIVENLGGYGVLAIFDSSRNGQEVLFRADMDALPINETTNLEYRSLKPGISHKCGHDGHMTILAGLAAQIAANRPEKGRFLLLFQPAEETGKGAMAVLSDPLFSTFKPDFCFALHNLPGYSRNAIVLRNGTFAAASKGMVIRLKGRTSHASEPEKGLSPAAAMARLMAGLPKLSGNGSSPGTRDFVLLTLIHASLGTPAFGTSPGEAVLMVTLRAYQDSDMLLLIEKVTAQIKELAEAERLTCEISFTEEFPAVTNHPDAVNFVKDAAKDLGLPVIEANLPFRWSEDFAHYTGLGKSVLFGIGTGKSHPPLHDPDYDFPDKIITAGVSVWEKIYRQFAF